MYIQERVKIMCEESSVLVYSAGYYPYSDVRVKFIGTIYSFTTDEYLFFIGDDRKNDMIQLMCGNICISYNGVCSDSISLLGADRKFDSSKYVVYNRTHQWQEYDILLNILKYISYPTLSMSKVLKQIREVGPDNGEYKSILNNVLKYTFNKSYEDKKPNQVHFLDSSLSDSISRVRNIKMMYKHVRLNGFLNISETKKVFFN